MSKKFCMLCGYFKPVNWCLGFCENKKHYLNKLHRYCGVGYNSPYSLNDPEARKNIIRHWKEAIEFSGERYQLLLDFYQSLEETTNE